MIDIVSKKEICDNIFEIVINVKSITENAKPGQFFVLQADEKSERVPLSISNWDSTSGDLTFVIMPIGESSRDIVERDFYYHACGPLGKPSDLIDMSDFELKREKICFLAGGVGGAPVYPQAKYLFERGFKPTVILAARNENLLLYEDKLKEVSNLYIATDDGSKGFNGLVTDCLEDLVKKGMNFTRVIAIGPMIMMKFAVLKANELGIKSVVSLNPIMLDGTGMCGCCRCSVGGKIMYACVDGPEFPGDKVDFDEALRRLKRW